MNAAIDFGSHRIRVLVCEDERLVSRTFRSVFTVLPDSQEQRAVLARLSVPYAVCDSQLAVIGDYSDEVRCVSNLPAVPIFADGQIAADDPPARQILNVLVESMLPESRSIESCAIIAPGSFTPGQGSTEFLEKLVSLRGYRPVPVSAGLATVLAEGAHDRFSAIGISLGAQCCEIALVARGNQIDREIVPKAGEWMDIELARQNSQFVYDRDGQCYLDTDSIPGWKHAEFRSLSRRDSLLEHTLCNLYAEMLSEVANGIEAIVRRNGVQSGAIPVLCSGGVSRINGFEDALRQAIRSAGMTAEHVGPIRVCPDPMVVARGGLIQVALQDATQSAAA